MSLAYETSEEAVSPFRCIIIYQRQLLLSNDIHWWTQKDSNLRSLGYEPNALDRYAMSPFLQVDGYFFLP